MGSRDLAERLLVEMAPLRQGTPEDLAREIFALIAAFDYDANRAVPSLADGEWRDAPRAPAPYVPAVGDVVMFASAADAEYLISRVDPSVVGYWRLPRGDWHEWSGGLASEVARHVIAHRPATAAERVAAGLDAAPASVPTPAIDPRRTVGAVVRSETDENEFIVLKSGEGDDNVRAIDLTAFDPCGFTRNNDVFLRWATREECERHGIPYVDRTAPASKPVDREGLVKARDDGKRAWLCNFNDQRDGYDAGWDAAIAYMKGGA